MVGLLLVENCGRSADWTANVLLTITKQLQREIKNVEGLVIGKGSVIAPYCLCLKVSFDDESGEGWDELTPGKKIVFTAKCKNSWTDYAVTAWRVVPDEEFVLSVPTLFGYAVCCLVYFYFSMHSICWEYWIWFSWLKKPPFGPWLRKLFLNTLHSFKWLCRLHWAFPRL